MKLKYGIPKMDIVPFTVADVIAASVADPTVPSTDPTVPGVTPTEPGGLTNGGTGSGGSASFGDMFPNL